VETRKINKKEDKYFKRTAAITAIHRKKGKRRKNRVKLKRETRGFAREVLSPFLTNGP
jgi:hypothetical protein